MGQAIGSIIGFIIMFGIPWYLSKKKDEREEDTYESLQRRYNIEKEKWKK